MGLLENKDKLLNEKRICYNVLIGQSKHRNNMEPFIMGIGNLEEAKEYLYRNRENYTVEYPHTAGKECYIFFSSNGLYAENDFQKFKQSIWEDDRYEWQSITQSIKNHKTIGKIIYVRDIYK